MSEFKLFYRKDDTVKVSRSIEFIKQIPENNILWIDLNDVDEAIEFQLEDYLKIYIQEEEEMIEIETSSRYIETRDTLVVNTNFLLGTYDKNPVSFIMKNNILNMEIRETYCKYLSDAQSMQKLHYHFQ